MQNNNDLLHLLTDLESDRVERKASLSDPDRIREAICAFANDLPGHREPGVIFIGANDDGSGANLSITDKLLLKISTMRDDGLIQPLPSIFVDKKKLNGSWMVVVEVQPSLAPPVRFRGRTWVRVGPRRAIATPDEEKRLAERRRTLDLPFDLLPLSTASIDDLDLEFFKHHYLPQAVAPDILEETNRSLEDQLKSLRFLTPEGIPTTLGILAAGKEPRRFIPGAYIQFVRFDGKELTDPIRNQMEISGHLSRLISRLDDLLELNINIATQITSGPVENRFPDYPIAALQQLCRNAILHRDYEGTAAPVRVYWFSDRIAIHNPGGPFGAVTKDNFGQPHLTDYRNYHLAEAMKVLGYIQRFGVGIQIARQELEKNGNPPVDFDVEDTNILATVNISSRAGGDKVMSFRNPYNNKGMLAADSNMFFGRKKEMQRIGSQLWGDEPQCVSIVGERRIGKSSLANRIFSQLEKEDKTLTIYLDCDALADECSTKDRFFQLLDRRFIDALKEKPGLEEILETGKKSLFSDYAGFKAFVKKCGKVGVKTVIFLDEFEHLPRDEKKNHNLFADDTFFSNLRALANDPENCLAYVTITLSHLDKLTHQAIKTSNFWNIFEEEITGLLDHASIEKLRTAGFEQTGLVLTADEIEKIHYYAGDFPFFNQVACSFAWHAKLDEDTIDWDSLEVKLSPFYRSLWERRSTEEQKLLKKLEKKKDELALKEMKTRGILVKKEGAYLPFSGYFSHLIVTELEVSRQDILDTADKVVKTVLKAKKAVSD